jgi:quinoprotein glucose dehydrogenase
MKFSTILTALLISLFFLISCKSKNTIKYSDWTCYGGNKENNHYSSLTEIDTNNVTQLKIAWEYHTADADAMTQIQVNPIIIDGVMFGVSAKLKLFALDASSGKQLWVFNPVSDSNNVIENLALNACRGVAYYSGDKDSNRIFYTAGANLFCINAATGKPFYSFGNNGKIDLHNDLGTNAANLYVTATTPGMVYKDMIIIGSRVAEEMPAAPGHIRAYDVHTGKLRWIFHTIPQPGEAGFETWQNKEAYLHVGGANAWSGFSLDEKEFCLHQ